MNGGAIGSRVLCPVLYHVPYLAKSCIVASEPLTNMSAFLPNRIGGTARALLLATVDLPCRAPSAVPPIGEHPALAPAEIPRRLPTPPRCLGSASMFVPNAHWLALPPAYAPPRRRASQS